MYRERERDHIIYDDSFRTGSGQTRCRRSAAMPPRVNFHWQQYVYVQYSMAIKFMCIWTFQYKQKIWATCGNMWQTVAVGAHLKQNITTYREVVANL